MERVKNGTLSRGKRSGFATDALGAVWSDSGWTEISYKFASIALDRRLLLDAWVCAPTWRVFRFEGVLQSISAWGYFQRSQEHRLINPHRCRAHTRERRLQDVPRNLSDDAQVNGDCICSLIFVWLLQWSAQNGQEHRKKSLIWKIGPNNWFAGANVSNLYMSSWYLNDGW